ncbi:hypothetical protein IW261DRAFT_1003816 [Armillaria novae-zelandiae]|uniref:F-box domain-containing protein n=1 Tax=Armillaria novae-zelandiae TaxID=153914 RepID=A0AA39NRH6_9AGAR|nr:hypothetical protein IW261DRAFT_1003816 [Armillaria novae-zelandiae]
MCATNAMFHLDAAAHSVPEPTFPPDTLNSDVSDILRATRPLIDTDRDLIFPNIEDLRRQVSVYDTLLNRIDEIRSEVQRRHDAVHKAMMEYSSSIAPIRRLPVDVLRSVFREIQISRWGAIGWSQTSLDFSQGPWTLSHVCGAWRDVILSYPQLWSHIVLRFGSTVRVVNSKKAHSRILIPLEVMILRSKQCPLDIVFRLDFGYDQDMAEKIFPVILGESRRWRTSELLIPSCILRKLEVVRGKIPCLESLTLRSLDTLQSGPSMLAEDIRSLFADAPCLRNIALHGTYGLGDLIFPLHITRLTTSNEAVSNLGIYQSLVECHLEIARRPGGNLDISLPRHIFLPNVRRLLVPSLRILGHFFLPSLHDLTFTHNLADIRGSIEVVNDFLYRSQCSLTRLAFSSAFTDDKIFIQDSLLFMDTVVCLEVGLYPSWNREDILLNALASDQFLPNLQNLHLFHFMASSSQNFLTAMAAPCRRHLRSVKVFCSAPGDVKSLNEQFAPMQLPGQHFIAAREQDHTISYFGDFIPSNLYVAVD